MTRTIQVCLFLLPAVYTAIGLAGIAVGSP